MEETSIPNTPVSPPVVNTLVHGPGVNSVSAAPPPAKLSNAQLYDSKGFATTNLAIALVSLFIIPYMAIGSFSGSCIGLFYSFKNKSSLGRKLAYIIIMIISITSLVLKNLISQQST